MENSEKKIKFEMHFHTDESSPCGKVPAKQGVNMYMENGYNGLVVTDHFSENVWGGPEKDWNQVCEGFLQGYRNAKKASEGTDFQILLGMEIRFPHDENDFLVYGISEEFLKHHPWIYRKELPELYQIAEEEGLFIVQAHPYRSMCFQADVRYLHGIEVFNGNPRHQSHNEKALETAEKYHLVQTKGSDFHQPEDIGVWTELPEMPENEKMLVRILKDMK